MGFLSGLSSFVSSAVSVVGSLFGGSSSGGGSSYSSSSTTTTIYEPDKLKIAELEKEKAEMLVAEQKELIKLNAQMQGAIIEAEARSFEHSANILKSMMESMNIIAQQRFQLLENGHLEIVEKIETLYSEFEKNIQKDNHSFQMDKLPEMLQMLSTFPEDSDMRKIYSDSVTMQVSSNMEFINSKLKSLKNRQEQLITSSIQTKDKILESSAKLVEGRMKFLDNQLESRKELAILHKTESIQEVKKLTN